ncbi:helix-turn-helix domain-containing protein [Candidatus Daviesbacteria bacterium]|nr:helix-turn-helix domain-containing protein [Candidatus Daviesbacteria bacterium]
MEEFYTVEQAARTLKVHPLTVRRYIKEGKLKAYRVGGNIRIALEDLRSFTQSFIPHSKPIKAQSSTQTQPFSFADPLLNLKGRGLSISKLEQG